MFKHIHSYIRTYIHHTYIHTYKKIYIQPLWAGDPTAGSSSLVANENYGLRRDTIEPGSRHIHIYQFEYILSPIITSYIYTHIHADSNIKYI